MAAWPDERPLVVLAPQHDDPDDGSDYEHCDDVALPGSCFTMTWHALSHPNAQGSLVDVYTWLLDHTSP